MQAPPNRPVVWLASSRSDGDTFEFARMVLLATHWYTMSAQAKTFLDRLSDLLEFRKPLGHRLRGKTLAVLCTGSDQALPASFEQPFALTANYLGMTFAGSFYARFDERSLADPGIADAAQALGRALLDEAAQPSHGKQAIRGAGQAWSRLAGAAP